MNSGNRILIFILSVVISMGSLHTSVIHGTERSLFCFDRNNHIISSVNDPIIKSSKEVENLNESLKRSLTSGDLTHGRLTVNNILQMISANSIGDAILSESYYLIGVYFLKIKSYNEAIDYLNQCISIKEKNNEHDIRYARALYNLSVVYSNLEDLNKFENYASKSVEIGKTIYGESNPDLVSFYLSLISAYVEQKKYEKALDNSNTALTIANKYPGKVSPAVMADLYYNLGVCYDRLADFSKAKIYLDKTESIYKTSGLDQNDNFINLLNGLAITYYALGLKEEAGKYYEKGVALSISNNSSLSYNLINSYCIFLGNDKEEKKGEKLLKNALVRAKARYELYPRDYFEVLNNYAAYLRDYRIDNRKSIECYLECMDYIKKNVHDQFLKTSVYIGYSSSLKEEGKPEIALEIVQSLLFSDNGNAALKGNFNNPGLESLKPDLTSLWILRLKYNILWDIYKRKPDQRILEAASNTSELIVSLIDKVRINISEEESRLILGDKYRESYLNAIRDFNILYKKTADPYFREKAFEYSEKSKVAVLLTSTRELKATQFHIPSETGDLERDLKREISLFNVRISEESASENPNMLLIAKWKENLLEDIRKRDSLILIFEKQYPEYYAIKYNTQTVSLKNIPAVIDHSGNYISYVISDTVLYTFVVNRKHQQLLAIPVDTSFFNDVKRFRNLLSLPSPAENASKKFNEFQSTGYRLYKTLIEPVRSYLISDKLYISPDGFLSYLPFETIPTDAVQRVSLMYRDLNYMMNDFDISYTYSATFLAESVRKEYNRRNKLIAFAPNYPEPIDIQSVLMSRQAGMGQLNDLPYARQEAEFVSKITGGILFENNEAKESVYKNESGKYDIIHLAMHTLVNEKDPMHSTLIFNRGNDSPEDGYLKTFEIYGIPLKAKMVVLSSCNTGTGLLNSGEGILSLARGFIYSGSQSVVMSMWEIEDKSGTEIVEMFYKNLKKGYSKSVSLRKARINFLRTADRLRSHPYFWSALVVYGNNRPLYYSARWKVFVTVPVIVLLLFLGFYFRKRKYS
jgi:CHAT domain-containing protein